MHAHYDAIYLSPHLDDAALSCGGQIYQRTSAGQTVLVVTIMAGDPASDAASNYIESLHERWELAGDAAARRRQEDLAACRILGAQALHLALPDCIYRLHPQSKTSLYLSDADIFGEVHPSEFALIEEAANDFAQLPSASHIYAPLTVGHHVDHQLVRLAAEKCWGGRLLYYEEYPYAQKPGAMGEVFDAESRRWHPRVIELSEEALEAKIYAIEAFRSQLSTFFRDRNDLLRQVMGYASLVGGECVWRRETEG
jgi:LmbE family N-acetylglucosaminyl deacetylase